MRITDIIAKTLGAAVIERPGDVPLIDARVPHDGDVAHRQGVPKSRNPFAADDPRRATWDDDWEFRHSHALPSAADAPGGRLRPRR